MLLVLMSLACHSQHGVDDTGVVETTEVETASYRVSWASQPDPVPFNDYFDVQFVVEGLTEGVELGALDLVVDARMPAHGHGMNVTPEVTANGDGTFDAEGFLFHMQGHWQLSASVESADAPAEVAVFDLNCCD